MTQYLELGRRILSEGKMVFNKRTGKNTLTVIDADFTYDVGNGEFPLDTTRLSYWKPAIAELLGYLRGLDDAAQFKELGTKTWEQNAAADSWLNSPFRRMALSTESSLFPKNEDIPNTYMGRPYGPQLRDWRVPAEFQGNGFNQVGTSIDQLRAVYEDLKRGEDNRGEILMMWNPGEHHVGCLRPCMYSHHFSLLDGVLYLHSTQRSCDVPLGLNFNQVQVYVLLLIMAKITGHKPGKAYHKIVNAHVYEDQLDLFREHMSREPSPEKPELVAPDNLSSLEDVETWLRPEHFSVLNYNPQGPIAYPFSV